MNESMVMLEGLSVVRSGKVDAGSTRTSQNRKICEAICILHQQIHRDSVDSVNQMSTINVNTSTGTSSDSRYPKALAEEGASTSSTTVPGNRIRRTTCVMQTKGSFTMTAHSVRVPLVYAPVSIIATNDASEQICYRSEPDPSRPKTCCLSDKSAMATPTRNFDSHPKHGSHRITKWHDRNCILRKTVRFAVCSVL